MRNLRDSRPVGVHKKMGKIVRSLANMKYKKTRKEQGEEEKGHSFIHTVNVSSNY